MNEPAKRWSQPGQFYSAAATAMRRILVDQARARQSLKRGQEQKRVALEDVEACESNRDVSVVDCALSKLEKIDERMSKIVELRYFVGLGLEETAAVMGISARSVRRDWATARVWLAREMKAIEDD